MLESISHQVALKVLKSDNCGSGHTDLDHRGIKDTEEADLLKKRVRNPSVDFQKAKVKELKFLTHVGGYYKYQEWSQIKTHNNLEANPISE